MRPLSGLLSALSLVLMWPQTQRPTFRTEVNYVELDVSVTAKDGSRVRGLTKDDFEVLESGKPQAISTFSEVHLPMPPAADPRATRRLADPGIATNVGLSDGRVYLIVLDYGTLSASAAPKVKRQVGQFITDFLGPNDLAAVVSLGRSSHATPFTNNRARLLAALNVTGEFVGTAAELGSAVATVDSGTAGGAKADDEFADMIAAYTQDEASRMATDTVGRFDLLSAVARFLKGFQGRRKAIVYVSQGVDAEPAPVTASTATLAQNAVAVAMKSLTTALVGSNVTLYSIDPRGLSAVDPFDGGGSAIPLSDKYGPDYLAPMRNLRALAEDTGGFATIGFNNLADPFRRIVEDNSSYYVLGYESDQKLDGGTHKISVRVRGRDVDVRTRDSIEAVKPKPLTGSDAALDKAWHSDDIAGLLARPLPSGDLGLTFRATASAIGMLGDQAVMQLAVEVDGRGFTFATEGVVSTDDIEVAFQALDAEQALKAARTEATKLRLRPETRDAITTHGWRYVTEFTVPPGLYQVRIAAAESSGHRAGSVFLDVPVPDPAKAPLTITGLAVTSQAARLVPTAGSTPTVRAVSPAPVTVARTFNVTDTLTVLAGIIDTAPGNPTVTASARLRAVDGSIAASVPLSFNAADARAGGPPRVFVLTLRDVAPGDYDVVVQASNGAKSVSRSVPITVVR